ncbi:UDP-glycosyltransferase 90A1 [Linum grandiflorum]
MWLDQNSKEGSLVLYVAFGSQSEISSSQLREIAQGLQDSGVKFPPWVIRSHATDQVLGEIFEARVKDQGIVVQELVDQREILTHPSVHGFLSQCGCNSMMEAVSAGVPILAWPMLAGLGKMVKELIEGEKGKEVRKRAGVCGVV